jgi:hypothetical protein
MEARDEFDTIDEEPSYCGARADIQQSEPTSPSSMLCDYVIFVDDSGDACLDPIDPRFPMLNLVFCIKKKDHYFDHVVPNLRGLKEEFFGHTDLILHESEMRWKTGVFTRLRDQSVHQRWMIELLAWID